MGPRLELQLLKVQEGLAEGRVLYHRYEQRSTTDAAEQQIAVDDATRLRAERRRQQEENVRNKAREKARVAAAQQVRVCLASGGGRPRIAGLVVHPMSQCCSAEERAHFSGRGIDKR